MATDLASLRIAVDSTDVKDAKLNLDNLGKSASNVERSTSTLKASTTQVGNAFAAQNKVVVDTVKYINMLDSGITSSAKAYTASNTPIKAYTKAISDIDDVLPKVTQSANDNSIGLIKSGSSAKLSSHEMMNLSYQLQDVVVGFASGQKPMTIFMQQGSQISQIMMNAGVGIGALVKQLSVMAGILKVTSDAELDAAAASAASAAQRISAAHAQSIASVEAAQTDRALAASALQLATSQEAAAAAAMQSKDLSLLKLRPQ